MLKVFPCEIGPDGGGVTWLRNVRNHLPDSTSLEKVVLMVQDCTGVVGPDGVALLRTVRNHVPDHTSLKYDHTSLKSDVLTVQDCTCSVLSLQVLEGPWALS